MRQGFIPLLTILMLFACQKKELRSLGDYWEGFQDEGKGSALRNGDKWSSSAYGQKGGNIPESFYFGLYTFHPIDSVPTETVSFGNIPIHPGSYKIYESNAPAYDNMSSSYTQRFDDLHNASFAPNESKNNWIKIEAVDTIDDVIIVKGSFDVHYRIKEKYEDSGYPGKVHFTNGVFEVTLK